MVKQPDYKKGDRIRYKSGKIGYNYGFANGQEFTVVALKRPMEPLPNGYFNSSYMGWRVLVNGTNAYYPCGWFEKVQSPDSNTVRKDV